MMSMTLEEMSRAGLALGASVWLLPQESNCRYHLQYECELSIFWTLLLLALEYHEPMEGVRMCYYLFNVDAPPHTCRTATVFHSLPSSLELCPSVFEVGILEISRLCDEFLLHFPATLVLCKDVEEQRPMLLTCHSAPPNMPTLSTSIPQTSLLKGWDVISALRACGSPILVGEGTLCCRKVDPAVRWILDQA